MAMKSKLPIYLAMARRLMLGPFSFGTARERLISALKEVEGERKMVLVGVSLGGGQVVLDLIRGEPGSS